MTQLAGDCGRHRDGAKHTWQQADLLDQDQVTERSCVRDHGAGEHGSDAERLQVGEVVLDVLLRDRLGHPARLEKVVEFEACLEAEQLAQLEPGEVASLVGGERKTFERSALEAGAAGGEAVRELIGNAEGAG